MLLQLNIITTVDSPIGGTITGRDEIRLEAMEKVTGFP